MKGWRILPGLLWLLAFPSWAAPGVMLRTDSLRAAPSASAASIGTAAKGQTVEVLARQGGWSQVKIQSKTGWVRLLSVRGGVATKTDVAGELQGVLSMGTTRRDSGKVVAVAGVRGLSEEELKQAHYDPGQLQQLEGYATSNAEAARFAADAGLRRRDVAYLPAPQAQQQDTPWGGGQ